MIIHTCSTHLATSVVIQPLCPSKSTKKTKTSTACVVISLLTFSMINPLSHKARLIYAGFMHAVIGQLSVARVLPLALMSEKAGLKCRRGLAIF